MILRLRKSRTQTEGLLHRQLKNYQEEVNDAGIRYSVYVRHGAITRYVGVVVSGNYPGTASLEAALPASAIDLVDGITVASDLVIDAPSGDCGR